jgi:hypothetical protein
MSQEGVGLSLHPSTARNLEKPDMPQRRIAALTRQSRQPSDRLRQATVALGLDAIPFELVPLQHQDISARVP